MGKNSKIFLKRYNGFLSLTPSSVVFFVILGFVLVLIIGCSTVKYRFNDIHYDTPEAALQAQREWNSRNLALINPTENPLGGRALCVLPSRDLIEKKAVRKSGNPKPEVINYVVSSFEMTLDAQAQALQNRKIFNEVKIVKSGDPESIIMTGYESTIYYVIKGPEQLQWFLRVLPNKIPLPIFTDTSLPQGVPRLMDWLKNIEKLARQELGK